MLEEVSSFIYCVKKIKFPFFQRRLPFTNSIALLPMFSFIPYSIKHNLSRLPFLSNVTQYLSKIFRCCVIKPFVFSFLVVAGVLSFYLFLAMSCFGACRSGFIKFICLPITLFKLIFYNQKGYIPWDIFCWKNNLIETQENIIFSVLFLHSSCCKQLNKKDNITSHFFDKVYDVLYKGSNEEDCCHKTDRDWPTKLSNNYQFIFKKANYIWKFCSFWKIFSHLKLISQNFKSSFWIYTYIFFRSTSILQNSK